jgi:hypothetical protein
MDIASLEVVDTAPIHLKDAEGNPLYDDGKPVRIVVFGPASDQYARLETKQTQRQLRRLDDNDGKRFALTADERLQQTAEDLADITFDFENLSCGGKTGRDLFLAVYGNRRLGFIANQVTAKLGDWGNFKAAPVAA